MPSGNEVQSLRSLATAATINRIFKHDKPLLAKYYQLGVLPVCVIDEIYCQWARTAIKKSQEALDPSLTICVNSRRAVREEAEYLDYIKRMVSIGVYPRKSNAWGKPYIQSQQKVADRARIAHDANCEVYRLESADEIKKLGEIKDIFTKEERQAITIANPDGEMQEVYEELTREASAFSQRFSI